MMQVIELEEKDKKRWDNYVYRNDHSDFFQLYGWKKIMEEIFGCKTYYLSYEEGKNVKGILPIYMVRSWIFGNSISSMPGGICADNEETAKLLFEKAKEIAKKHNVKYLLLGDCYKKWNFNLKVVTYNTSILKLTKNPDELWNSFDDKARNQTRKAIKVGLITSIGKNYLQDFYQVFSINMRDLGTPVFPYKFFKRIISEFPEETNLLTVKFKDKVIGGMFLIFFKDTISDPWASSLRKFFLYCPNNLLYWEAFKYGCNNGFRFFDMGRSQKGSGTLKFKKQWGTEPRNLYYQYYLHRHKKIPFLHTSKAKDNFFNKCWKKLPVGLANFLGPVIRKNVPFG